MTPEPWARDQANKGPRRPWPGLPQELTLNPDAVAHVLFDVIMDAADKQEPGADDEGHPKAKAERPGA